MLRLFDMHCKLGPGRRVLELGCGGSQWLPLLARRYGCAVEGIELDRVAADLARANLCGAGVDGVIHTGDAFAPDAHADLIEAFDVVYSRGLLEHFADPVVCLRSVRRYVKPGGILLTTVPNLRGLNFALQMLADVARYRMRIVYDRRELAVVHREAGFEIVDYGYVGIIDAYLSATTQTTGPLRRAIHAHVCRLLGMASHAWLLATRARVAPELSLVSPNVFAVARRSEP